MTYKSSEAGRQAVREQVVAERKGITVPTIMVVVLTLLLIASAAVYVFGAKNIETLINPSNPRAIVPNR